MANQTEIAGFPVDAQAIKKSGLLKLYPANLRNYVWIILGDASSAWINPGASSAGPWVQFGKRREKPDSRSCLEAGIKNTANAASTQRAMD